MSIAHHFLFEDANCRLPPLLEPRSCRLHFQQPRDLDHIPLHLRESWLATQQRQLHPQHQQVELFGLATPPDQKASQMRLLNILNAAAK